MPFPISAGDPAVAFLGCGNLARALLGGLVAAGYSRDKFYLTAGSFHSAKETAQLYGARAVADNPTAARLADVILLGVKPNLVPQVLAEIAPHMDEKRHLLVSLAAGLRLSSLQTRQFRAVVRAMPNLASRVGGGVTAILASPDTDEDRLSFIKTFFSAFGKIICMKDDKEMDVYTALCGSGPAYFYYFLQTLINSAKSLGIKEAAARASLLQTGHGALGLMRATGQPPAELIGKIAVPGGTTRAALGYSGVFRHGRKSAFRRFRGRSPFGGHGRCARYARNGTPKIIMTLLAFLAVLPPSILALLSLLRFVCQTSQSGLLQRHCQIFADIHRFLLPTAAGNLAKLGAHRPGKSSRGIPVRTSRFFSVVWYSSGRCSADISTDDLGGTCPAGYDITSLLYRASVYGHIQLGASPWLRRDCRFKQSVDRAASRSHS